MNLEELTKETSVQNLISGCLHGKNDSWELFFELFHRLITGTVARNSKIAQEDTVQAIYLRLVENDYKLLRRFQGNTYGSFLVYLKEISKNVVREEYKNQNSKISKIEYDSFDEASIIDPKSQFPNDTEILYEKMMDLDIAFREVMVLRVQGYKAREIAEILQIPLNTVLSRMKRAMEKIKKNLERE